MKMDKQVKAELKKQVDEYNAISKDISKGIQKYNSEKLKFLFCLLILLIFIACGLNFYDYPATTVGEITANSVVYAYIVNCVLIIAVAIYKTVEKNLNKKKEKHSKSYLKRKKH